MGSSMDMKEGKEMQLNLKGKYDSEEESKKEELLEDAKKTASLAIWMI